MGKVFSKLMLTMTLAVILGGFCPGCRSVVKLFTGTDPVDMTLVPVYWDGPVIGPGMNLNIIVSSVTTTPVSMSVIVDQKGEITLQHLIDKPIPCDGLTLEALKAKLLEEYKQYYKQPQVTVTFGSFDGGGVSPWGTVRVMGEVGNPGPVNMPPTMDLTVTRVLQLAGGVRAYADKTSIKVHRCDREGNITTTSVDLREIGEDGRFDKDIRLKPGDVVFVPESWY